MIDGDVLVIDHHVSKQQANELIHHAVHYFLMLELYTTGRSPKSMKPCSSVDKTFAIVDILCWFICLWVPLNRVKTTLLKKNVLMPPFWIS